MDGHRPPAPKGQAGTESGSQAGSFTFTFSGGAGEPRMLRFAGLFGFFGAFGCFGWFGAFGAFVSVGSVSSFVSFVSVVSVGSVSSSGFSVSATFSPWLAGTCPVLARGPVPPPTFSASRRRGRPQIQRSSHTSPNVPGLR